MKSKPFASDKASFFFSRGQADLSGAGKLFTTLAAQLANTIPALEPLVYNAIIDNPESEQWKVLILQPLLQLGRESPRLQPIVLVIDALDGCEDEQDARLILRLFSQARDLNAQAVRMRIFITSRPETPIRLGFKNDIPASDHQDFILHHISQPTIEHDIAVLLGENLSIVLRDDYVGQSLTGDLDDMYTKILMRSITPGSRDQQEQIAQFRQIVGSIVVMFDSLHTVTLCRPLGIRADMVHLRLHGLHSVLDAPTDQEDPIWLIHPSFRGFLNKDRCSDLWFWVAEPSQTQILDYI